MSLTREEVERRLKRWSRVKPDDPSYLRDSGQREALQTALAVMDERDALAAEGRLLRTVYDALDECHETWGKADPTALSSAAYVLRMSINRVWDWLMIQNLEEMDALSSTSLITAEVARVRRLEAVLEAAEAQDPPASANLARALAAYRESERPGGEVCHEKITAREKKGGD